MSVVDELAEKGIKIHWVTRKDFSPLVSLNTNIEKIWELDRKKGWRELCRLGLILREKKYDIVYDAHSNLRSSFLRLILGIYGARIIRRSKQRWRRVLLFYFGINTFPKPFRGMLSYRKPLQKVCSIKDKILPQRWIFKEVLDRKIGENEIVLCPGAAWKMKRWPSYHWKELIKELRNFKFIILGGEEDFFCEDLVAVDRTRVVNMAGKLSLIQSCELISRAPMVIGADTGLIHVADILGIQGISLMGPTAFGFPSGESIVVLEKKLSCRPCSKDGRGKCSQQIWQRCMIEISPQEVALKVREMLKK